MKKFFILFCIVNARFFCVYSMRSAVPVSGEDSVGLFQACAAPRTPLEHRVGVCVPAQLSRMRKFIEDNPVGLPTISETSFFNRFELSTELCSFLDRQGICARRLDRIADVCKKAFSICLRDRNRRALGTFIETGSYVGKVEFIPVSDEEVKIDLLRVERPFYHRGFGSLLLGCVLYIAHQEGRKTITLFADALDGAHMPQRALVKFYRSFGFKKDSKKSIFDDRSCHMRCQLK